MRYIAHRGLSTKHEQNTVEAIQSAIQAGFYGIEIDVQLCKTGEIVLAHDIYVDGDFISNMTISELRQKGLVTLEDVYSRIPYITDYPLFVDIKGSSMDIVSALSQFYTTRGSRNVVMCSFNRNILYALPSHFKKGTTFEMRFHHTEYEFVTRGVSHVLVHWTCLDHNFVRYCTFKDIQVLTYTHKNECDLEHISKFNVDGIITDCDISS